MATLGQQLLAALRGRRGDLDAWLETVDESEVRKAFFEITESETLRMRYARSMLQALIPNETATIRVAREVLGLAPEDEYIAAIHWPQYLARRAVAHADALLAELDQSSEKV